MPDRHSPDLEKGSSSVRGSIQLRDQPRPIDLSEFFEIGSAKQADPAKFALMPCGEAYIGEIEAGDHSFSRGYGMVASRKTDDILILAIASGSLKGFSSNGPVSAGANEVVMIGLGEILTVETSDLAATAWLLPRPMAYSGQFGGTWWHGYVLPSTYRVTRLVVTMMYEATKLYRSIEDPADGSLIDPVVVMLSSVLRSAQAGAPGSPAAMASNTLLTVKRYIDECLSDPDLGVDILARQFGMSRASLYREFASLGGIAEYIRRQRLQRAQYELRTKGNQPLRLAALARKLGFKSAASFSRSFTTAFGMSPRKFKDGERAPRQKSPAIAAPETE